VECHSGQRFYHLEQRNLCAEPERECNPVWDIIQFPVRRRSTAADCQCDNRLLQDRLAHDGWDPGTCINCHPNSNSYANGDRYSYSDCYRDVYSNSYCNSYSHSYSHCHTHCDSYCYSDAYFHTKTNPDAKRYGFAKATSNSAAAPVGPWR
jgi:hypothetical protein